MASLWDLVEKPKEEPQKEAKEETPEVVEAAPVEEKVEKPKTTKAAKTIAKKENKQQEVKTPLTLEEQIIANKDPNLAKIINHLVNMDGMEEKMKNPKKSFKDMWNFVQQKAKTKAVGGCAVIEDAEVYGWAVHYYDEENPK